MKRIKAVIKTISFVDWCGLSFMSFLVLCMYLVRFLPVPLFSSKNPEPIVKKVNAFEKRGYAYCFDPIICIRDVGEEQGWSNQEIMEMIRIARAESHLDPFAKNPTSTASGVFQILVGTWEHAKCEGDRFNFIDNIKCAYQVRILQGNGAWNASREVWDR